MIKMRLGGITPRQFLREYWQKKPLLVRQAIPGFQGLLSKPELLRLATDGDIESRLVTSQKNNWRMQHGPFTKKSLTQLPGTHWTLLMQDLNHFVAAGRDLLRQFSFIPYARLDDLMVSYAVRGGGVGPHFDSYDVFLLQGKGERRWRISTQGDLRLKADAPLKILKNFKAEQEWTLVPGDMLYLPPNIAREGVAQSDCWTYSIGFRAPSAQELAFNFLNFLQDELKLEGLYHDPDLSLSMHPGEIGSSMLRQTRRMLSKLSWNDATCARFLGIYLTEPKPQVFFTPPQHALSAAQFRRELSTHGIALHLKSRMLCHKHWIFINGECTTVPPGTAGVLRELSDRWMIMPNSATDRLSLKYLRQWYSNGYLALRRENDDARRP